MIKYEYSLDLFAFSAYQDSNTNNKIGEYLKLESYKVISISIQTLIEKIKAVVFEKDELEYRYMSILIAVLPVWGIKIPISM